MKKALKMIWLSLIWLAGLTAIILSPIVAVHDCIVLKMPYWATLYHGNADLWKFMKSLWSGAYW
jgi:hypothetical protein